MLKRLSQLNFTIGLFFTIVAVILLIGYVASSALHSFLNLYSGVTFLIFGLLMMLVRRKANE